MKIFLFFNLPQMVWRLLQQPLYTFRYCRPKMRSILGNSGPRRSVISPLKNAVFQWSF